MIKITEAAQIHFSKLLKAQEPGTQIRVFVINPGTLSAECNISYCSPSTVRSTDIEIKFGKLSAYIDEISAPFLKKAEIDLITNELGSQLTLKAPNLKRKKASDSSSLKERIEYFIRSKINPQLANHKGMVSLIEINDGYAILRFSGACNGCSMVDLTLKEGIEKQLLSTFKDELRGVKDITKHQYHYQYKDHSHH